MKHFIRDGIIFCIDTLAMSVLYRKQVKKISPLVRVVVFHDVADGVWFERVIEMLSKKFHFITPLQFETQAFNTEKINILITFDDGYQSWVDVCLPVLSKHNLKGLFFINSGLLESTQDNRKVATFMKERLYITPKKSLTWEGAQQLLKEGHTIGGHTISHPNLAVLDEASIESEVLEDKKRIEAKLGVQLAHFAYPFGTHKHWNKNVLRFVIKAGYTFVYTTKAGFVEKSSQQCIPRICLEKNQSTSSVARWINGGYDLFSSFK